MEKEEARSEHHNRIWASGFLPENLDQRSVVQNRDSHPPPSPTATAALKTPLNTPLVCVWMDREVQTSHRHNSSILLSQGQPRGQPAFPKAMGACCKPLVRDECDSAPPGTVKGPCQSHMANVGDPHRSSPALRPHGGGEVYNAPLDNPAELRGLPSISFEHVFFSLKGGPSCLCSSSGC